MRHVAPAFYTVDSRRTSTNSTPSQDQSQRQAHRNSSNASSMSSTTSTDSSARPSLDNLPNYADLTDRDGKLLRDEKLPEYELSEGSSSQHRKKRSHAVLSALKSAVVGAAWQNHHPATRDQRLKAAMQAASDFKQAHLQ